MVSALLYYQEAYSQTKLSFYYDAAGNQTSMTVTITTPRGIEVNPGQGNEKEQ